MLRQSEEIVELHNHYTDDDQLNLCWFLTYECNLNCPYCVESHKRTISKTAERYSTEQIYQRAVNLNKFLDRHPTKYVKIQYSGGEPTLYNLVRISELLSSPKINEFAVITNFTQSVEYYANLIDYVINKRKLKICFTVSYHEVFTADEFKEKLKDVVDVAGESELFDLKINCVIQPGNENKQLIEDLADAGYNVKTSLYRQPQSYVQSEANNELMAWQQSIRDKVKKNKNIEVTYADGTTEWFDHIIDFRSNVDGGFQTTGYHCSAGITMLQVQYDGSVTRADCQCINRMCKPLGSLDGNPDDIEIPTKWFRCMLKEEYRCQQPGRINYKRKLQ